MNEDLISRSALAAEIQSMSVTVSGLDIFQQAAKDCVLAHISTQPTIDAVPVAMVRGNWWDRAPRTYTCGSCGREQIYKLSVFPHCGAKMDGQEQNI